MSNIEWQKEWDLFYRNFITHEGWRTVVDGLWYTVRIAVFGLLVGIIIGTLIATVKMLPKKRFATGFLSTLCDVYVGFFRGTPIIVQLLIGKFILFPSVDPLYMAICVFGMNSGAYVSEIMRSGIQAVDIGQLEAARAMGLGYWISMFKVVIPQAIKNILPTLGNEFITLIKETSVVGYITIIDVTKAFKDLASPTYKYLISYLMLALIYLVLVMIITYLVRCLERRLKKVDRN